MQRFAYNQNSFLYSSGRPKWYIKKKKLIERHKSCRIIIKAHLLLLHLEEIMLFCLDNKELTGHVAYCSCEEGFISLTT